MINFAKTRERNRRGQFVVPTIPSGFNKKKYYQKRYQKNKKLILEKVKLWSQQNPKKRKITKNKWRAKNKELTNFLTRQYHYRRKHNEGSVSFEELKRLYKLFPVCPYCNINKTNSIDHITPLSRGGTNNSDNLVPVCISCNSKKRDKTLWEFLPILAMMWSKIVRHQIHP